MRTPKLILIGVMTFLCVSAGLAETIRLSEDFDVGWRFVQQDAVGAERADFDDGDWRKLDLPHDWSIEGDYAATNTTGSMAGWLPSGIGWYRREIEMPDTWRGKAVTIEFEGVYMNSDVWLNGVRVGGRPYGYMSFTCDLTPHLKPGRNVLAVRVDNSLEPSARWYHGCGIYGHVRIIVTDPVHVPYGGVFVQTPTVSAQAAGVHVATEVKNSSGAAATVEVQEEIIAGDGRSVGIASATVSVKANETQSVNQDLHVVSPELWSVETPVLYTLKTRVLRDGAVADEVSTPFGIRSLRFDANNGFFLNGEHVKIKGVCEHQGGSPCGAAMPEAQLERRLRQLRDMGCNSIRVAHNPQLPAFYDLCDRMGILVMDEIFDGWHKKAKQDYGSRFFKDWWQRDVTDWIRRGRNHPSVIFWSIGDETGAKDELGITEFIHQFDTSRPVTGGDVLQGVDVAGFNGRSIPNDAALEKFHRENPARPLVIAEEPHTFQTRGFYRTVNEVFRPSGQLPDYAAPEVFSGGNPAYRSSYDNCGRRLVARNCWQRTVLHPWIIGEYRWSGFDYLGEAAWAGNQSLAREFNFGVLDLAGFPKDEYYFHQSVWTEQPMVHLLPHWTHPGLEGKIIPVVAYANADAVELFLDGKSLGRKPRSSLFECVWQVSYCPGELKAIAYRGDKAVAETIQRTAGLPVKLELTTDNANLKPDRHDLALVRMAVRDAKGTLVPDADHRIALSVAGPARWLGGENGDPVDVTPQRETERKVFAGLAQGFYAGKDGENGPVEVAALAILGAPYFADSTTVTIAFERIALRGALAGYPTDIRFTTDGSTPSTSSRHYTGSLALNRSATIRAAVFQGGKVVVMSSGVFTKGARPVVAPSMGPGQDMGSAEDPTQVKRKNRKKNPAGS